MPRRLILPALALAGAVATLPGTAATQGLCDRLTVPNELELDCRVVREGPAERAVIEPLGGTFRLLSRLSLRRLDRGQDPLAWTDPSAWLEQQMILDLDGMATLLRGLGRDPDSPFGSAMLQGALDTLADGIEGLSRLPLSACDETTEGEELTCRFGVEPLALNLRVSLVAEDDERYVFNTRTFNEQRLRHFSAIANSFAPD